MTARHDRILGNAARALMLLLAFGAVVLLLGCSGPAEQTPHYGGILTYNRNLPDHGLDPWYVSSLADREIAEQIFEGLLQPDSATFEPVPCLAEEWSVQDSGRTYVFRLRKGVRFQDNACFPNGLGREITIEDVRYSFERNLRGPKTSWGARELHLIEGAEAFLRGETEHVAGIELRPPRTIAFHLRIPAHHFRYVFYSPAGYVIPKEAVEHYGQLFGRNPVGTGPFRLALWNRYRILLVRNDHYWGKDRRGNPLPYLAGVQVAAEGIPVMSSDRFPPLLDVWMEISLGDYPEGLSAGLANADVVIDSARMAESAFLVVNFRKQGALQSSSALRHAFFDALNVQGLWKRVYGHAPLTSLLPSYFGHRKQMERNKGARKKATDSTRWARKRPVVRVQLPDFPLDALSRGHPDEAFVKREIGGFRFQFVSSSEEADIRFVSYQWLYPDPEEVLRLFCTHSCPWGYSNPRYDSLFVQFLATTDKEKRLSLAGLLVSILDEDAAYCPLFQEINYYGWRRYVHGFRRSINPFSYHFLKYVWLDAH